MEDPALEIARHYWAAELGRPWDELFDRPCRVVTHGLAMQDYHGVFGLFEASSGHAVISVPVALADSLMPLLEPVLSACTPAALARALEPVAARVIGPAVIQYVSEVTGAEPSTGIQTRPLGAGDAAAVASLRTAVTSEEWKHGGSDLTQPCFGAFVKDELLALAGYEIWGGAIAHIAVVSRTDHRGLGCGRAVVQQAALHALAAGLLPQYRTLMSNASSLRIAARLGFEPYAVSLAVRLR
jgi:GNAT superfamily N-acetyltransferase